MRRPLVENGSATWLWVGLITAATLLAYGPALRGQWLWDDALEVGDNPVVHAANGWWLGWVRPEGMDYFPVKGMVQWAEWHAWGGHVLGYHLANIALHLAAAFLLWRLLDRLGVRHGWVGAFVLALHPLAVEPVAWIAELKTMLSAVFVLLASIQYVDSEQEGRESRYWLALACFVVALLSKSTVVMLPVAFLMYAFWRKGRIARADLVRTAPFFLASLALGLVTVYFQRDRAIGLEGPMPGPMERIGQAGWSLLAYLASAVAPVHLSPIYGMIHPRSPVWLPWALLGGLCLALVFLVGRRFRPHVLFAVGTALVLVVPILGILPMSYLRVAPRADHLAYLMLLPLAGIAAAGAGCLLDASRAGVRLVGKVATACGALALLTLSHLHAETYASSRALWGAAVEHAPDSWLAQANYGKELLDSGDPEGAAQALDRAVALRDDSAEAHLDRANAYKSLGRFAAAESDYRKAIALDPAFGGAFYDLGALLLGEQKPAEAVDALREALRRDPRHASAHNELGLALVKLGQDSMAQEQFDAALRLDPRNREACLNLGNLFARQGKPREALERYRAALAIDPGYAAARANMAAVERAYGLDATQP